MERRPNEAKRTDFPPIQRRQRKRIRPAFSGGVMNATLLYRIAFLIFMVTAVGHTYAVLSLRGPSPEGRAVYDSMNSVHFQTGGRSSSYGGIYRGLGLSGTVSMLFLAFLSWHLGGLARSASGGIGTFGWAFLIVEVTGVVLSFLYFPLPAMVLSGLRAVIVGSAGWLALSKK